MTLVIVVFFPNLLSCNFCCALVQLKSSETTPTTKIARWIRIRACKMRVRDSALCMQYPSDAHFYLCVQSHSFRTTTEKKTHRSVCMLLTFHPFKFIHLYRICYTLCEDERCQAAAVHHSKRMKPRCSNNKRKTEMARDLQENETTYGACGCHALCIHLSHSDNVLIFKAFFFICNVNNLFSWLVDWTKCNVMLSSITISMPFSIHTDTRKYSNE